MLHFALAPACFIYPIRLTEKKNISKTDFCAELKLQVW